jgi:hypothetical protein
MADLDPASSELGGDLPAAPVAQHPGDEDRPLELERKITPVTAPLAIDETRQAVGFEAASPAEESRSTALGPSTDAVDRLALGPRAKGEAASPDRRIAAAGVGPVTGGEGVGRLCVEEHHAGDVVGIASREHPNVWSTRGVTDDDIGAGDSGKLEQGVHVRRDGDAVLGPGGSSVGEPAEARADSSLWPAAPRGRQELLRGTTLR